MSCWEIRSCIFGAVRTKVITGMERKVGSRLCLLPDSSNMGCGFDRIENLLWRVCHGELDGYEAERVVVMIGTNNLSCNTDDEIIRGIAHLVAVIARHQPSAGVEVIGLLPRRGMEDRVSGVNTKLEEKIRSMNLTFRNPGTLLLGKGGKIDESLFRDGLHPNEKGYGRIAPIIAGME